MSGRIISYTGTQGTGKTTSAMIRAAHLKQKYPSKSVTTLLQIESLCPFLINKGTGYAAQMWIFTEQLQRELVLIDRFDLVVSDHTVLDAAAYAMVAGMEGLAIAMLDLAQKHMHLYQAIYFRQAHNNPWCVSDGHRSVDEKFRSDIELELLEMYAAMVDRGALACEVKLI